MKQMSTIDLRLKVNQEYADLLPKLSVKEWVHITIAKAKRYVSEYLKEELDSIKNKHRFIIFIDDLDRGTPERALESLESVKTFFDIEGIIYVIGMDPSTIDPIIRVKWWNFKDFWIRLFYKK